MTRARLTLALTRLISGENRLVAGVTALCLSCLVLLAGGGLAKAARGVRSQLAGSEILARLTRREPSNPQQTAIFLRYLNAMAPAVLNMEIPPEKQVRAFQTLYNASQKWLIALRAFGFMDGCLEVSCTAEDGTFARRFYEEVKASGQFSNVTVIDLDELDQFTIFCEF